MQGATRKLVSYACVGGSREKFRWTPEAVLTCKSIVKRGALHSVVARRGTGARNRAANEESPVTAAQQAAVNTSL